MLFTHGGFPGPWKIIFLQFIMHTIEIKPSEKKDKKYKAVIDGTKNVHFGQAGASDMTQHKNEDRKHAYIQRHKKHENWDSRQLGFSQNICCGTKRL